LTGRARIGRRPWRWAPPPDERPRAWSRVSGVM